MHHLGQHLVREPDSRRTGFGRREVSVASLTAGKSPYAFADHEELGSVLAPASDEQDFRRPGRTAQAPDPVDRKANKKPKSPSAAVTIAEITTAVAIIWEGCWKAQRVACMTLVGTSPRSGGPCRGHVHTRAQVRQSSATSSALIGSVRARPQRGLTTPRSGLRSPPVTRSGHLPVPSGDRNGVGGRSGSRK